MTSTTASDVLATLSAFAEDPSSVGAEQVARCRAALASSALTAHASLTAEARGLYNRCLEPPLASRPDVLLATTHVRALCLALIEASADAAPRSDMDKASHASGDCSRMDRSTVSSRR